jgi:phenylpyruvate tautomerase PptA (4-oxalocrotonate tautomerase family)
MPLSRLSVPAHLPPSRIRALADAVHESLVETCGVEPNNRFQLVSTYASRMMFIDPTYGDVKRTPDGSVIEILLLEGRTAEQKKNLFRRIADRAAGAGFAGDDVMITLIENVPANWSLGHGHVFSGHQGEVPRPASRSGSGRAFAP